MDHTYWLKQSSDSPLFPDILWSRPESKAGAGKLLIVGGNQFGFGAPGIAYNNAVKAGGGVIRVLMPDAIRKVVKNMLPDADFAHSTPSGSFARKSLDEFMSLSSLSDAVLLAGDMGRNSETAMLLETYIEKYSGPLVITQDAVEYFKETPKQLVDRDNTLVVLSLSQLQKLFINTPTIMPITLSMGSVQLAETLHSYTSEHNAAIMTLHNGLLFAAHGGRVSSTPVSAKDAATGQAKDAERIWRVETAARAAVFWLQNPEKLFESVSTSLLKDASDSL